MTKKAIKVYSFLTGRGVLITLGLILLIAFIVRVILPLQIVFGDGYINFLECDAYDRMWNAMGIQNMPLFEGFIYSVPRGLLFPWLIAMLGYIFPIELVGVWLPPILAVGVVALVYLIGSNVFNTTAGLLAALFVSIIPSEFFHRSLLGYADHHIMEVFLMALLAYLVIKAIRARRWLSYYSVAGGITLFLYLANWTGGILMVITLALVGIVFIVQRLCGSKAEWKYQVYSLLSIEFIGSILYLALGGYVRYFWWMPGVTETSGAIGLSHSSGLFSEGVVTFLTPISQRTISELMPLLLPFGKFDMGVVFWNMHFFLLTFIAGAVFLWYWRRDKANLFVLIWALILLVITLNERRYLYYFTLPLGLLSAWGIYELGQLSKRYSYVIMFGITLILTIVSLSILPYIGLSRAYVMTPEWHNALVWLKEEPSDGMVTAWSDYGHWIQYTSEKPPNLLNGPGGKNVAKLFLTTDDEEAQLLLDGLSTQYLIVDRDTMVKKTVALEVISGDKTSEDSFAIRLLAGESVPYLELVYESENIKVYEYTTN